MYYSDDCDDCEYNIDDCYGGCIKKALAGDQNAAYKIASGMYQKALSVYRCGDRYTAIELLDEAWDYALDADASELVEKIRNLKEELGD